MAQNRSTAAADPVHGRSVEEWVAECPPLADLVACRETQWFNPAVRPAAEALPEVGLSTGGIAEAAARLRRFAPYLSAVFPATRPLGGIIESPLVAAPTFARRLAATAGGSGITDPRRCGSLWLKLDSRLPISGSIKARGGIYEVLLHAETLATEAGLLSPDDDYAVLARPGIREFFGRHGICVASTGNLGLSIGIVGARLGFRVQVHMSADARRWKKDLLRDHGVEVVEYDADYSTAITAARRQAEADPDCHFVDDENSTALFLGYAVAAHRLAGQLQSYDVPVDADHPLLVHLPCGVGGGPGGVGFGLKAEFGDAVRLVLAEPTHCPSMFLGVRTGLHSAVSVADFGIDGRTAADGLACARPSGFVGRAMQHLVDGYITVSDDNLFRMLAGLHDDEGIDIEPSAAAGLAGVSRVRDAADYRERTGLDEETMARATHIAWITGGSMVPASELAGYLDRGHRLLRT